MSQPAGKGIDDHLQSTLSRGSERNYLNAGRDFRYGQDSGV